MLTTVSRQITWKNPAIIWYVCQGSFPDYTCTLCDVGNFMKTNQTRLYDAEMKKLSRLQNGTVRFLRQAKGFRPNCSFYEKLTKSLGKPPFPHPCGVPCEHRGSAWKARQCNTCCRTSVRTKHVNKPCWSGVVVTKSILITFWEHWFHHQVIAKFTSYLPTAS